MPSSLLQMFPGTVPGQVVAMPHAVILQSTLDAGQFVFDAQNKVTLHKSYNGVLYYVAGMQLSANCDALSFSAALPAPIDLSIWTKNNDQRTNQSAIPFSQFNEFFPLQTWYKSQVFNTPDRSDEILISASGKVNQTPALAGIVDLRLFVTLMIYSIGNPGFVDSFCGQ